MQNQRKIEILSNLGKLFLQASNAIKSGKESDHELVNKLVEQTTLAKQQNSWFTDSSIQTAFNAWGNALKVDNLNAWLKAYDFDIEQKKVGVIMAGNIPLVGLHDALSVLISGHELHAKLSSKDRVLMETVLFILEEIGEEWKSKIKLVEQLKEVDSLIATGSDNSARYFEYYFRNQKKLIRKNRTSIAVLDGNESKEELEELAKDVFTYFGLGCRNVTKVYLPEGFDKDRLFEAFFSWKEIINHNKYANNYDYNKAVYMLNKVELIENGFLLLKEDENLHSPVGVLFYETYADWEVLKDKLSSKEEEIQTIVSHLNEATHTPFGKAQTPELWDYADGVDTLAFLQEV